MPRFFQTHQHDALKSITTILLSGLMIVCLLFISTSIAWAATKSRIETVQVRSEADGVYVDVQMHLELSPAMQDALKKGVNLYFVSTIEIVRERWYWFDATDAKSSRVVRLNYHPLLQQYKVTVGGLAQTFSSLPEALELLGQIYNWRIGSTEVVGLTEQQNLVFKFELDHKRLPRLFQVGVAKDKEWQLSLTEEVNFKVGLP